MHGWLQQDQQPWQFWNVLTHAHMATTRAWSGPVVPASLESRGPQELRASSWADVVMFHFWKLTYLFYYCFYYCFYYYWKCLKLSFRICVNWISKFGKVLLICLVVDRRLESWILVLRCRRLVGCYDLISCVVVVDLIIVIIVVA